ncbi:MAG: SDR family NAD(P)-dependent oxidoreductase [Deltaproteobacteria bacterium]|nr:MAG: SDR family NAD(P)-dependent oxidoreductase [Deltaproteobacteria bacterium]TMQ26267.1 MAG: SDR family NAD(P)-dependent oxidoreductase [Deltaproteobacteria bacterium]
MASEIKRKLAVVTGASSGIGFELARQCLEHEFDVLGCAEEAEIENLQSRLAISTGNVYAVRADLATYEGVEELYAAIRSHHRPVDALLLNAGVGVGGAFVSTDLSDELRMVALNCMHTLHLAKRVLPDMIARGQGRILITGSVVSTAPNPYQAVYGATKAFVMSFGEALRYELKDTGVTVTVLQPGATDTNFFERADLTDTKVGQDKKDDPALVAKQGFAAMMDGKDSVLGGSFKSRMSGLMNELLPETVKAAQAGKTTKPGSAKH